jgi:choline dehydrogenase-like flavoprotein
MIRSGQTLADGGTTQAEIAIVGAGAIGVALAVRLAGRVGRVVLIEAGGTQFNSVHNLSFFKAERIDNPLHAPTELNRRRMLGGTTSVWGGRCIPFDREDFAPTPDRPGWPISFAEFDSYVPEALEFLDAGPPEFSAAAALPKHAVPLQPFCDLVLDRIERYSKPTNVWRKWSAHLARSHDVTVIHGVACTSVITNTEGTRAAGLELRTVSGSRHKLAAETIVLACGGLETPRLLLASRGNRSCGLGNERDLVGRFYMTHLVSSAENVGALRFATADTAHAFDFNKTVDGVYGRRMILLAPEVRQRESLPNIVFRPNRPPIDDASHGDSVLSAMFLVRHLLIPPEYARSLIANVGSLPNLRVWRGHGSNIVTGIPSLIRFGTKWLTRRILATRKLPSVFLYRKDGRYPLEFNAEQMPNADSRVMLGDETDSLGMPRLVVRWKYRDTELDAICRAYRLLASAVAKSGLGEVQLDPELQDSVQRALVPQGGHHIGTVRMGSDSSVGVVDTNGEIWATRGLFVAGTAVLPTSGFANPTLTAVALAFRLAEQLVRRYNKVDRTWPRYCC